MRIARAACCIVPFMSVAMSAGTGPTVSSDAASRRPPIVYERIDLGTLGGLYSAGMHINDRGHVLGGSTDAAGRSRLFLWDGSGLLDLGFDRWDEVDLNRKGQIAGTAANGLNTGSAFLYENGAVQVLGFRHFQALNERGDVLGWKDTPGPYAPLIWRQGVVRDLPAPGTYAFARALNNRGEAVGEMGLSNGDVLAIFWHSDGQYETAALDGAYACSAGTINDRGQATGFCDGASETRGFIWQDGAMKDLGVNLGPGYATDPIAINGHGQIIGTYHKIGQPIAAFIWQDGVTMDLGGLPGIVLPPGYSIDYQPTALNEKGQVVGLARPYTAEGVHAFIWEDGVMTDLGRGFAVDINERGEVLGTSGNHAVVWRPIN